MGRPETQKPRNPEAQKLEGVERGLARCARGRNSEPRISSEVHGGPSWGGQNPETQNPDSQNPRNPEPTAPQTCAQKWRALIPLGQDFQASCCWLLTSSLQCRWTRWLVLPGPPLCGWSDSLRKRCAYMLVVPGLLSEGACHVGYGSCLCWSLHRQGDHRH